MSTSLLVKNQTKEFIYCSTRTQQGCQSSTPTSGTSATMASCSDKWKYKKCYLRKEFRIFFHHQDHPEEEESNVQDDILVDNNVFSGLVDHQDFWFRHANIDEMPKVWCQLLLASCCCLGWRHEKHHSETVFLVPMISIW